MDASLISEYFPDLTEDQRLKFERFGPLFTDWNSKINMVSRKDIDQLYLKHVLHSLGIAKVMPFAAGSKVLDIGTGGGFPGIPLAILFPDSYFVMVDSIGKKIKVVNEIIRELGIENAEAHHVRAEQHRDKYDFVVSRAVTRMAAFIPWTEGKIKEKQINPFPNGILYLKGGDLDEELLETGMAYEIYPLSRYFPDPFFETKATVYVRLQ